MAKRFQDEAISVREALVSLVGIYVLKEPKLANIFHNLLLARLCDNGISVVSAMIYNLSDIIVSINDLFYEICFLVIL